MPLTADSRCIREAEGSGPFEYMPENKNPPYLITFVLQAMLRGSVGILFLEALIDSGWKKNAGAHSLA